MKMYFSGDATIFSVICFALLISGSECQNNACDLDFHIESESVMLMEGENVSVLCDATCYGSDSNVQVVWMDTLGRQIGFSPNRIFSVRYNSGLMNRLLIIRASVGTSGTFICSATRNGVTLQLKPLNIIILGSSVSSNNIPQVNTGPRRGDMVPDRDIEYRPVRSVDHARYYPDSRLLSIVRDRMQISVPDKRSHIVKLGQKVREGTVNKPNVIVSKLMRPANISKVQINHLGIVLKSQQEAHEYIVVPENSRKNISKGVFHRVKRPVREYLRGHSTKSAGILDILSPNFLNSTKILETNLAYATNNENNDFSDHILRPYVRHGYYSRVKRQISDITTITVTPTQDSSTADTTITYTSSQDSSTETNTIKDASMEPNDDDTSGIDFKLSTSEEDNTNSYDNITSSISIDESVSSAEDKTESTREEEHVDNTKNTAVHEASPCPYRPEESSNFGKYGVLAFAITLAVAVLLTYTVVMIIFMPRILAKRKNKHDVQGAVYKKMNPDTPLADLNISNEQEADNDQDKQETSDLDSSIDSSDNSKAAKKGEDVNTGSASVSTFLLRQESQKDSEKESKIENTENAKSVNEEKAESEPNTGSNPNTNLTGPVKAVGGLETLGDISRPQESTIQNDPILKLSYDNKSGLGNGVNDPPEPVIMV